MTYAENVILTGITIWMLLYAIAAVVRLWAERPTVGLDPNTGHYRAARSIHQERQR